MMSESRKTLRARIEAVLKGVSGASPGGTNANNCESAVQSDFVDTRDSTIPGSDNSSSLPGPYRPVGSAADGSAKMEGIYRVHFAGFDRTAYQAMEDTLLLASQSVQERFVPTDPVSMALGAAPDVLVINLNHPDASQLGKTLRPAPGVPVVWVSISPEQKGVGEPGSPLFTNLVKAMQDVLAQRATLGGASAASGG